MNTYDFEGLQRIKLIGREGIINSIFRFSERHSHAVVLIEGEGGVGKTAILTEVYRRKSKDENAIIIPIIDFYFFENRTTMGLAKKLVETSSIMTGSFRKEFDQNWGKMREAYRLGNNDSAKEYWKKAEKQLRKSLSYCEREIWILLDTVEVLSDFELSSQSLHVTGKYSADEVTGFSLIRWLAEILRETKNCTIILSGRPPQEPKYSIRKAFPGRYWKLKNTIHLAPLNEADSKKYLSAVANIVSSKDYYGYLNIQYYIEKYGAVNIWKLTGGKPLRLAILADILLLNGSLPALAFFSKNQLENISEEETNKKLDRTMVEHLMDIPLEEGEVIRQLANLKKGADYVLLARLLGMDNENGLRETNDVLEKLERLVIVKTSKYKKNKRYFLHDEIYRLIDIYFPPTERARKNIFNSVDEYYTDQILNIEQKDSPGTLLWNKSIILKVERMHYRLWYKPIEGYADYFMLASAATRDEYVDSLLLNELLYTQNLLKQLGYSGRDFVEFNKYVDYDTRLRRIQYISFKNPRTALKELEKLESDLPNMPELLRVFWRINLAASKIRFGGEVRFSAVKDLDEALKTLGELSGVGDGTLLEADSSRMRDVLQFLISETLNYLGYYYRLLGNYQKALHYYQRAAAIVRKLEYDKSGLSGILTNQVYAMIMLGKERRGRQTSNEAISYAKKSKSWYDLIRAYNVRSILEERAGHPEKGIEYAQKAMSELIERKDERWRGMVQISMARAIRHQWNQNLEDVEWNWRLNWTSYLPRALCYLEGTNFVRGHLSHYLTQSVVLPDIEPNAYQLLEAKDFESLVAAYNESGCIWREVVWVLSKVEKKIPNQLLRYPEARLQKASGIDDFSVPDDRLLQMINAQIRKIGGSPYYPTLALANLGWHWHYQNVNSTKIEKVCHIIERTIGEDYLWKDIPPRKNRKDDDVDTMLWTVLGKMEMLRGYQQLREWRNDPQNKVYEAVKHVTLAFEYNYLIGKTTYDLRRAEEGLERRIVQSRNWETYLLPIFYKQSLNINEQFLPQEKRPSRLLRWLEERFGPYEIWSNDS